jgi:hypothetical protein
MSSQSDATYKLSTEMSSPTRTPSIDDTVVDDQRNEGCDPLLSSVDLIFSCMSLNDVDDSQEREYKKKHPSHEIYPASPKRDASDGVVPIRKFQSLQRRGRFLVWPACFGPDATLAASS